MRSDVGFGERVAIVSHNSARLLTALFGVSGAGRILVPVNFRLNAEEVGYIVEHCGAKVLLVDPELEESLRGVGGEAHVRARCRERRGDVRGGRRSPASGARRGRDGDDQLHERHHGAAQGRPADSPQPVAQRRHLRLAARHQRPRRLPAHAADVPLQRVGPAVRSHGDGRAAHRAAQGRRRPDPPPDRPARRHRAERGTDRRERGHRRGAREWDGEVPGRGRVRLDGGGRAAPDAHDRGGRDRARLGVRADLRAHRDHTAADDEPRPGRVRRAVTGRAGSALLAGGRARAGRAAAGRRRG